MSQEISLFDLLLSSKLKMANSTSHIMVNADVMETLVRTGKSPENEKEFNDRIHYLTNLFRRKKKDFKHGINTFAKKYKHLLEGKTLTIRDCSSMEKVMAKYEFGLESRKFGQVSKCEVCTQEDKIMGTTNLCQDCLNRAMTISKNLLKNELAQRLMPRKEESRRRRHSCSFLDRKRDAPLPESSFLPLLLEKYKIPKKEAKKEVWNGQLWTKYICPNE